MDCSARLYVSTECDLDGIKVLLQDYNDRDQALIKRRVEIISNEIRNVCITTLCPVHVEAVLTNYRKYFVSREYNYAEIQNLFKHSATLLRKEYTLKPLQAATTHAMMLRKDVFAVLPTSYGKTLTAICSSIIRASTSETRVITLWISPLVNLSEDLQRKLEFYNIPSVILSPAGDTIQLALTEAEIPNSSKPLILLSSPETLISSKVKRFLGKILVDQVVIHEAHTVVDWGSTFRAAYKSLNEVTDIVHCPVALFTATISEQGQINDTLKSVGVDCSKLEIITASPNRPEIFLHLKRKTSVTDDLKFLADDFIVHRIGMTRTIVFVNSIDQTTRLNLMFRRMLPHRGKVFGVDGYEYSTDHFSSSTEENAKRRILKRFADPVSNLKVLFSTIGYGLGIDNRTVRRIIIYGHEPSPSQMWQKVGRCARDNKPGQAFIFTKSGQQGEVYGKKGCIREAILSNMIGHTTEEKIQDCDFVCHTGNCICSLCVCCTICRSKCACPNAIHTDNENIYENVTFSDGDDEVRSEEEIVQESNGENDVREIL